MFVEVGEPVAHERAPIASRVAVREEPRGASALPTPANVSPGDASTSRGKRVCYERDASTLGRAKVNLPG